YQRGTIFLQMGEFEKAVDELNEYLKAEPQAADGWQNRAVAHRRLGNYEQAVSDASQALKLRPKLAVAYRTRALALAALNRYAEAKADVLKLQEMGKPLDAELQQILDRGEESQ